MLRVRVHGRSMEYTNRDRERKFIWTPQQDVQKMNGSLLKMNGLWGFLHHSPSLRGGNVGQLWQNEERKLRKQKP